MRLRDLFCKKEDRPAPMVVQHPPEMKEYILAGLDQEGRFRYRVFGTAPYLSVRFLDLAKHMILTAITSGPDTQLMHRDEVTPAPVPQPGKKEGNA